MKPFLPYNRLYHYRSFETAKNHILPEKKLRLSPIVNTNDPRENRSFIFSTIYNDDNHDWIRRNQRVSDFLRKDCKILCFSDDNKDHFWGYSYSRMWALYGGNHRGICLGLDKKEFIMENIGFINKFLFKKVIYEQHKMTEQPQWRTVDFTKLNDIGEEKYLREVFRVENLDYLFFTKNKEWESEEEIRLLYFSDNENPEYCSIKNSLKKIYLGVDFDYSNIDELIKLCPDVDIYKLEFKGHKTKNFSAFSSYKNSLVLLPFRSAENTISECPPRSVSREALCEISETRNQNHEIWIKKFGTR
ncbi:MAG: DUF2971 domain-containing protein [Pedobacter sp.]|nr:MAG: DUF2971 domain-containing protein [Pedobacter sp.]